MKQLSRPLKNQRGQTLIEYLIIIALVGVGSIALVRTVAKQVNYQFTEVVKGLEGDVRGSAERGTVYTSQGNSQDLSNFAKNTGAPSNRDNR
jgi:pilus assembly protein Flp/PilA